MEFVGDISKGAGNAENVANETKVVENASAVIKDTEVIVNEVKAADGRRRAV